MFHHDTPLRSRTARSASDTVVSSTDPLVTLNDPFPCSGYARPLQRVIVQLSAACPDGRTRGEVMRQFACRPLAVLAWLLPLALSAQEFRGTISGEITDPTGAMIAGAKVTATETNTGTRIPTVSDSGGQYTAPFLLPGDYDITVHLEGFKEFVRRGVHVGAGDHAVIDVRLEVGNVTQSLEVTADAPLLNTENASLGQAVTTKEIAAQRGSSTSPILKSISAATVRVLQCLEPPGVSDAQYDGEQ